MRGNETITIMLSYAIPKTCRIINAIVEMNGLNIACIIGTSLDLLMDGKAGGGERGYPATEPGAPRGNRPVPTP